MTSKRLGRQTVRLGSPVSVLSYANIGGKQEAQGPLAGYFDELNQDAYFGQKSWEKGESAMQQFALRRAMEKGGLIPEDLDYVLAGDLLNQCIGTSFSLRDFKIPFYGLYGACSTMGESLSLAALLIDGGFASIVAAMTSSHFCTAERQYRMPVLYGNQRTPTAQWTATASGCCILGAQGDGPYITHVTCGRIVDMGIKDANNMGAAMAPAAYDTLSALFRETGTGPKDYDLLITGDLGMLGRDIVVDLFREDGLDMGKNYTDCGLLLYDRERQDMHAGASGCGCSAAVLNGYLLGGIRAGRWKKNRFRSYRGLAFAYLVLPGREHPRHLSRSGHRCGKGELTCSIYRHFMRRRAVRHRPAAHRQDAAHPGPDPHGLCGSGGAAPGGGRVSVCGGLGRSRSHGAPDGLRLLSG